MAEPLAVLLTQPTKYYESANVIDTNSSHKTQAFTLIDLLIVMMIIGVLVMLLTPQFHSMITETKLNEAAGELVSGLQYAKNLAIQYQKPFGIKADVAENRFQVFDNQFKSDSNPHHDNDPPLDAYGVVYNPVEKKWYIKNFDTMEIYDGVHITGVPAGGEICFYPDGHSASSNNSFVLSFGADIDQRTIIVNGATGRISVE